MSKVARRGKNVQAGHVPAIPTPAVHGKVAAMSRLRHAKGVSGPAPAPEGVEK
jgi:hypothetical protein